MLKEKAKLISKVLFISDIFVTILSFLAAYWIRNTLFPKEFSKLFALPQYLQLLPIIILIWGFNLHFFRTYWSHRTTPILWELWNLLKVVLGSGLLLTLYIFALRCHFVSRIFIALFLMVNFLFLCIERGTLRMLAHHIRKRGFDYRNLLIVGTGQRALNFVAKINENPHWGLKVVGFIDKESSLVGENRGGIEVLGTIEGIGQILRERVIDEVIFMIPRKWIDEIEGAIHTCEELGIQVKLGVDFYNTTIGKMKIEELEEIPFLSITATKQNMGQMLAKRIFDLVLSSIAFVLLSPIFLVTAAAIKFDSSGPIIFKQKRVGLNGRTFTFYKFRSMVNNSEVLRTRMEHLNEMSGPVFKIKNDPRLTRAGRFIRKFSIDELPQLLNVLKGDMSLVGIRPPTLEEVEKYEKWQRRRLSMKPGITCLWQVNGRNKVDFERWMKMDLSYIDNWSLKLDFRILLKTIPAVFFAKGAM
jgi:exopolysaccharide biosynthesis polyprenyl glycosylphosphotransferase